MAVIPMSGHQHDWQEVRRTQGSRPGIWIVTYRCSICAQNKTEVEED